jgi:NADH dehydrogenase (ubiquinone) 1 alpha subcomplex subunit 5
MSLRRLLHTLPRAASGHGVSALATGGDSLTAAASWRPLSSKATTGLVGVPVVDNGRDVLLDVSQRVLDLVSRHVPETAHYRRQVEAVYGRRVEACKAHESVEGVEAALGEGQVEELIRMAEEEVKLIPKMAGA